jgi:hypothetical protein
VDGIIVQLKNGTAGRRKSDFNQKEHMDIKVPCFWTSNHVMTQLTQVSNTSRSTDKD